MKSKLFAVALFLFAPFIGHSYTNDLVSDSVDSADQVTIINNNFRKMYSGKLDSKPGDIIPKRDSTYSIGESGNEWLNGYFDNLTISTVTATSLTSTSLTVTSITINGLQYGGNPVGTVVMYISSSVTPSGWLHCDGSSKSTSTYSRLFSVIGYTYGGSGANFSLPDFRGVFPKGQGTTNRAAGVAASGAAYSGTIGAYSQDKFQGHWHSVERRTDRNISGGGSDRVHWNSTPQDFGATTNSPTTDGTNGTPRTGATTEPQSVGIAFIIYSGV